MDQIDSREIEYEPEYLMEFDRNPDIDDTPPMSLEEVLHKSKPFLMAYEGIKCQEEWEVDNDHESKPVLDIHDGLGQITYATIQQASWDFSKVRDKLSRDIEAHVAFVRAAKLFELTSLYEGQLNKALAEPVEALLDAASDDTWPAIRRLLQRET